MFKTKTHTIGNYLKLLASYSHGDYPNARKMIISKLEPMIESHQEKELMLTFFKAACSGKDTITIANVVLPPPQLKNEEIYSYIDDGKIIYTWR